MLHESIINETRSGHSDLYSILIFWILIFPICALYSPGLNSQYVQYSMFGLVFRWSCLVVFYDMMFSNSDRIDVYIHLITFITGIQ